jgi:hypothetical protein
MSENGSFRVVCRLREREKIHFVFYWCSGSCGGSWAAAAPLPCAAAPWAACSSPPLCGSMRLPSPRPWAVCAQQAVAGSRPTGKQRCRAVAASSGRGAEEWPRRAAGKQRQRVIPGFLQQRARLRSGRRIEIQSPNCYVLLLCFCI